MISIIIPVYNTGERLNKCLCSLVNQTYDDWQCLLVNDCSTDEKTLRLLNNWVIKDKRFILLNNPNNLGIEKTRFVGVNRILQDDNSEYIMFMDHDDWLYSKDSLKYLYINACSSGADIVVGRHNEAYSLVQLHGYNPVPSGIYEQPELKDRFFLSHFGINLIPVMVWAKLYKVDLVKNAHLKPNGLKYTDDNAWNLFILPYAKSLIMLEKVVYVHRWGGFSAGNADIALQEHKLFYKIRRQAIIDFNYEKGRKPLDIELKNVLATSLLYSISYSNKSKTEIINCLKSELTDRIWNDIMETIQYQNDEFSQALYNRDFDQMYLIQYQLSRKTKNVAKYVLKKIYSLFFN